MLNDNDEFRLFDTPKRSSLFPEASLAIAQSRLILCSGIPPDDGPTIFSRRVPNLQPHLTCFSKQESFVLI